MESKQDFVAVVEAALEQSGLSASEFGKQAVKDHKFVSDLRSSKRSPTLDTVQKVMDFIRNRMPNRDAA